MPSSSFQYQASQAPDQQPLPGGPGGPITMRSNDDLRTSAPLPMPGPSRGHDRERDRRRTRRSRHGSPSSSDALSLSSSSSSSYLEISRWYPSFGRSGGVLNAFWKTPSEHRQRVRRRRSLKKKQRGIFGFGNNSSSSSVNSDMAYGMGFVKKPKSRNFSPRGERAAGLEKSEGRPAHAQRRQTDEEILEIGRKLAKVARDSNREDLRAMGKKPPSQFSAAQETWDKYSRQNSGGYAASSRGIGPSKHGRHSSSSSSDDEWESASEGEYSSDESNSGLAYGAAVDLGRSPAPKSSVSRQSTMLSARPPEDIRPPDRKSSAVDPRLFGPVNSLRGLINTPCGYNDRNSVYTIPGPAEQRYAGSAGTAESASIEARPMQTVYPVQTSDPSRVDAARASGSFVSSHSSRRPEPLPIQAPKPIAPVRSSMYDEQRIRDSEQTSPRESRVRPSENKTFAETALVGAGVAALGAAIMAGRDKGKGKEEERDPELRQGRHERYGHDDHREEGTVVQDSRRAKELALEKEIERLERALADRNKAREQRKRDSKRDSAPEPLVSRPADVDAELDREKKRRNRDSRFSEPDYSYDRPETSRRVSEPGERPAAADSGQTHRAEPPAVPSSSGVDVFQFQVPDDAFRTRDSPLRAASPVIIDVTPAPSPPLEDERRRSRRDSFEDEMRDAKHIYDESMHSTAPISAVDMAAALAATEKARHHDEPERGRTLHKTQDLVQEEANNYYHARRMAEREVSSRSRSKSKDRSVVEKYDKGRDNESKGAEIVRIVTPPEMTQKPQKHKYSEPNADFRFDNLMSPKDLDHFRPHEYHVRDPSAERPRPYLNLVIPTPVPTPTPDSQKKKSRSSRSPEPVVEESKEEEVPEVVISPRGEVVEAPQTPTSKRVSWGPSETQQYEVESPDRSSERNSRSYERQRSPNRSSGWGATAAAVAGIAAAAALSKDDKSEHSSRDDRSRESTGAKSSEGSRSPPSRKVLPKGTASSRVLDDEPEDVPPAPGPKPASPRSSQMPGAFADDLDFAATLAAGLQDTGFDPNIVIEDAAYRRRDSPPGSNEHTGVYMQPYSETVTDLGMVDIDDGSRPARQSGYVIGELADTPASEKGSAFDWAEGSSRRQSKSDKRRSVGSDNIEVQDPKEEPPKLSKKEQRKIEKAARAAKLAEEEDRSSQPADAGDDDWKDGSTSRKSKRSSKQSKRTSLGWDDADTPVNDRRVSVPVDAFDDLEDTKPVDNAWDELQRTGKSKRDSKGYDLAEDPSDRRERRREERRRSDFYEPVDRDVTSVVSDTRHDDRSNGRGRHQHDDERSVVSAPDGKRDSKPDKRSSKEEKRSSGGFWGLLKGSNGVDSESQSKKDNAGTLGAGAGLAGAVAAASIAAGSLASRSDAAEAPSEQEETQHVIVDVDHPSERRPDSPSRGIDVFDFQDPEITPRVIKPAIDPQYGDLLPLPPSPSEEQKLDFDVIDDLPSLPDSRPATPPGQEKLLPREKRDSSQKRPAHSRRRSAYDVPLKSPSHTAIPIAFRMGQRSSIPSSPRVVSNPTSAHQSPAVDTQETFSSPSNNKRSPRPPSWDRPTSWESTREIKPLYLIERSAHAGADSGSQEHDDSAENTPLPPSRESPAPESEDDGDVDKEARVLDSSPLFVDTAVTRTVPLGSQESTPKGLTQTDSGLPDSAREFDTIHKGAAGPSHIDSGLPRSAKDADMPLMEEPHQSPLLESSYATPTGSPRLEAEARPPVQRDESTESISDFRDALDRPALEEDIDQGRLQDISRGFEEEQPPYKAEPAPGEKNDKPGYFSSALSMLPAAGLAGVGALLGRGSRDDTAPSVDDHPSQGAQESTAKSTHQPGETSGVPEFEASQAGMTAPIDLGDQGQALPTAGGGKSGPDTPLDTIEGADVSVPNDSPAAHRRPEGTLPISDQQQVEDISRDIKELGPDQEAFVTDDTIITLPSSSTQPPGNDLSTSPIQRPEDMETIPETPVDTVEWPESTPKKKKGKKGKKKQSSIGAASAASLPVTAVSSARDSSDLHQDTVTQEEPVPKTIEEPSLVPHSTTSSWDNISRESTGTGVEPSSEQSLPKGGEPDISSEPYLILGEGEGKGLTDDPEDVHETTEASTIPGPLSQSQSQDEGPQVGGHSRRSSSNTRRLRSSRSSMSPHGSVDRPGSPDVFHSGDDGITSPPNASASARSSTGQKYKKTRSLRSSRRSSLASQGSGRGNEPGLGDAVAFDQPGTGFGEHQELHDVETSSPIQQHGAGESLESPFEVVEQPVSSPLSIVEAHSDDAQPEIRDESEVKAAGIINEPAFAQPEPFSGDVQRTGSPIVEDTQRSIDLAESSMQEPIPSTTHHTSPQRAEEGSAGGLASESLDKDPDVLGPSSSHSPLYAGDEAVQPPSEPVMEGQPSEKLPTDLSGAISQRSEPEQAVHDDLQQEVESVPPVSSVEHSEQPFSSISVEEPIQALPIPSSPPHADKGISELERSTAEGVTEPQLREPSSILAPTEDDNSFTTKKSKKDKKKRKSSTIIGGTIQSSGTSTPAELELGTQPVEPSVEPSVDPSTSPQDDFRLEESSPIVKGPSLEPEQQPGSTDFGDLQHSSKSMEPGGDSSQSVEPILPVSENKSSIETLQTADPTVLPILDDVPSEIAIPELEKPDLGSQEKPEDILDEDEIARREAEADLIRDEEAEMSRLQSKKKLKPKEKTRLKQLRANVDRRAEEAAAMAPTASPIERDSPGAHIPDSSIQQPLVDESTLPVTEEPTLTGEEASTGRSPLVNESLPPQLISGSDEAVPVSTEIASPSVEVAAQSQQVAGTSPTSGEISPRLDESIQQRELQPEAEVLEDAEDLARREAEAALIRDEEAELARLESKKKPNKKDKVRMRVLRSNSERRAQEADAAAPPRIEEQDTADMDTPLPGDQAGSSSQFQGEDSIRDPVSQEMREIRTDDPQSIEDAIQTSDNISASTHPHVDSSFSHREGDLGAADLGESSQIQPQTHDLSQSRAEDPLDEATVGTGPSQFEPTLEEQLVRHVELESTQPDSTRPDSAQFDSTHSDSAQIPQIRVEDTSSQLGPLPDDSHTTDAPLSQSRRGSLPQIEEAATDPVEMQSREDNFDMPGIQIEDFSQARDDGPSFEPQEDVVATGIHSGQAIQAPAQEPLLVSEAEETERGTNISSPFGGSEQPAVTVTELPEDPESEWPVMSKKSKKDKKKKRKGTISDGSGQNSGTVTPFFDASEQSPVVESRDLTGTVPGSSEDMAQPISSEPMFVEQGQQPSTSLALDNDDKAKDIKLDETTAGQPLEGSIQEQPESSLSFGGSVPASGISDDNIAKDWTEEASVARPLESSFTEPQEVSLRTEGDVPENDEETIPAIVPEPEPEQAAFDEWPEFQPVSKKSKKDKKKKRKNTMSEDLSLPSGSATPIAIAEPEQPVSLAETPATLEGGQPALERSLPLDITEEPAPIPSTIEETSATKSPVLETVQSAEEQPLPHSVSEEPSKSPKLEGIPTSIPEPEPEQLAQEEPEFFITKKSKKDKKRKKTLSGTVTPMNEFGAASLPSEPAAIQEPDLGSTQQPSSPSLPPLQPSEPEKITSSDLIEGTPLPTEHAEELPPAHLPETEGLRSASPLDSKTEKAQVELDQASRPGRKSDGWGFLAGAIAGAGVASTIPHSHDKSPERAALPEDTTAGHSPIQTVGTDTLGSRPSLNFADVVQTATASDFKDQERSQVTDISRDQPQSLSFPVEERGQSDDVVQEPKPIQEDTSDVIAALQESQEEESASLSRDVVDSGLSSTRIPLEQDTKQEEPLSSGHFVQEPSSIGEVAPDLQGSPREEQTTISEPQYQLDDWTQTSSSKKKKKKDKKRKSSSTPWSEAESGAHTPITEERIGARDLGIDTNERSMSLDTGDLSRPQDNLVKQPEPEPELKATEEGYSAPLAGDEFREQASLEGVPQSETTDIAKDTITSPKLHGTDGDRDATPIETEDQALGNLGLGQIQKESHTSETISSPILDPTVDDRNEPLVTATPLHEEARISTGQAQESSDRPSQEHDELTRDIGSASTEAFATPLQLPTVTQEVDPWATTVDDQPLDLSVARDSGNDFTFEPSTSVHQTPTEPADTPAEQSLEPTAEEWWEPTPKKLSKKDKRKAKKGSLSTGVPELTTPTLEGDSQQISKETASGALGISSQQNSPVLGQQDEPVAQDVEKIDLDRSLEPENEPIFMQPPGEQLPQAQEVEETPVLSRKMSKKEKRKAKKASLSAWEDDIVEPVEPIEPSQSQIPVIMETQAQGIPTTSSPISGPELGQKEATQISDSAEPQLEEVSDGMGLSTAKDATAEDEWATPISRKKSKKDKKKGKQSSSGSVSGIQTPAIVEPPILHGVEAVESGEPVPERSGTPERPTEISQFEDHDNRRLSEMNTSLPDNNARGFDLSDQATDDASASQGRKDHRSAELYLPLEGANDEVLTGRSGDASTPSHHSDHRSAELYVPGGERSLEVHESTPDGDDWDIPSDDQSKKHNKAGRSLADKTPTISTPMEEFRRINKYQNEASRTDADSSKYLRSPDNRGKELERMQPSPDLWDDEDYFKPKPASFAEPNQEPFSKFDIHPAVARGLNTSPDRRVGEERPLVGLGLIHRHSSIFQEDEGHVPKLLTMTSDNVSTDSVAIQEAEGVPSGESSHLGSLTRSATVPARPGSSRSYDEGLSPAVKQVNTKEWFTFETGPAHGANVPLARSVSPDKFNNLRPVSPGLPRSPQFPPPRSPTLSPQFPPPRSPQLSPSPSPRSPHFPPMPPPRSPQYSPRDSSSFEAARDPSKKGSVAALAERFGGAKKATGKTGTVSDYVDNHNPQDDDLFDEPAMWEAAEHKPLRAARLDVDSDDYWAVHDKNLEDEQSDPDMQHSGQGAAATSHGREPTTPGSDNVSEPRSQPDIDAGTFTPQIPDQASREAEIPLESVVVESPVLGSQASVDFPTDEQEPMVKSPRELPDASPDLPGSSEDANLHEFLYHPQDSPTSPSRSPVLDKISSFEEPTPTIETRDDDEPAAGPSAIDFSRSLPTGLPSVQEEPHEEEAESSRHVLPAGPRAMTPDFNRDSGVVTGSPVPPRVHQFESAQQQRDSGVHMRDPSGVSPRLLGTRAFSPQPARLSHSSIEDEGANVDDKSPKRSLTAESEAQRRFREATPVLEAQDAPITPEPRKNKSKSRKYPDLGPSPGKKAAAASLAGGGALLAAAAARSRSPSPAPSPAASLRSFSDKTDELRASALPRQRRAASSNTGISRARTPEPLNLRAESPSLLRHSGTPPLRSRRSRSGDLRSLSQLSNRSHSDLGAQASSSPASASAVSAANKAAAVPTPASSDLRRATTAAAVAQGTNNAPTANEGRVRTKDMADVYVSQSFLH